MSGGRTLRNSQIIILGLCISTATIISSFILAHASMKVMRFTKEVIKVTGSAQQPIRSDYTTWQLSFGRQGEELSIVYNAVESDLEIVKAYLLSKGVAENELAITQVNAETLFQKTAQGYNSHEIQGYRVNQTLQVSSHDVDKVTRLSRECTELINKGVQVSSHRPQYFYTKLDELKVEMLARATENAKLRAVNMVTAAGNSIGVLRSARMGVFQITSANSTAVSDYGINDTSSLEKKVTAVVSATFSIN